MNISPSLLRTFLAVADAGGFSRAAENLNSTQSTVSHQIRRLEHTLGATLLDRTGRQTTFSSDGRRLVHYARKILALMDEAQGVVGTSVESRFRFGIATGLPDGWTVGLVQGLKKTLGYRTLHIRMDMSEPLRKAVEAGELHAALIAVLGEKVCDCKYGLRRESLVWVTALGAELKFGATLPLALPPAPCTHRLALQKACRSAGLEWREIFSADSPGSLTAAVRCGFAIGLTTRAWVGKGLQVIDDARLPNLGEEIYHVVYGLEIASRQRTKIAGIARAVLAAN